MRWSDAEYQIYLHRQAPAAADPPEAAFMSQVRALARRHGWLCYHTYNSMGSDEGFPDLVLVNPEWIIFAELKTRTGKLTKGQAVWLDSSATRGPSTCISGGRMTGPRLSPG